jgi:hypothetical protein
VPRWFQKLRDFRRDVMSETRLEETIARLVADGELTPDEAAAIGETIKTSGHETRYIIGHLCVHLAIGIGTPDFLILPLGTIGRGSWVVGARIVEMFRRNPLGSRVHSLWVLLVSLIPYAGNFAYLIPLRTTNADAPFLYANHISYLRTGCSLEQSLRKQPAWRQRQLRRLLGFAMKPPAPPADGADTT